jgi:hypothetical protein
VFSEVSPSHIVSDQNWSQRLTPRLGTQLDELYVTSAKTEIEGPTELCRPDGGSLYLVKGLGFKGVERFRYAR